MKLSKYYKSIINETKSYAKKPFPLLIAFVAPLLAILALTLIFSHSTIKDIPISVLNLDNASSSRLIARYLDATQALNVVYNGSDRDYAEMLMKEQKSYLTLIIPAGSEEKIKHRETADITALSNGANLLYSKIAYRNIATAMGVLNAGVQLRRMETKNMTSTEALARALPIRVEISTEGNPWYDYAIYVIPGLALALLQMSASFSSLWLFRNHIESSEGRYVGARGNKLSLFIGKFLPLFIVNSLALITIFYWVFPLAGVPSNGASSHFFWLSYLFLFVSMGFGALLSIINRNLVTSAQTALLINAPAFVFAGYTFPRWAMPEFAQNFAQALPITHVLDGFFPALIFGNVTNIGVKPLLIIGAVLWGLVIILASRLGDYLRDFEEKLLKKKQ